MHNVHSKFELSTLDFEMIKTLQAIAVYTGNCLLNFCRHPKQTQNQKSCIKLIDRINYIFKDLILSTEYLQ